MGQPRVRLQRTRFSWRCLALGALVAAILPAIGCRVNNTFLSRAETVKVLSADNEEAQDPDDLRFMALDDMPGADAPAQPDPSRSGAMEGKK